MTNREVEISSVSFACVTEVADSKFERKIKKPFSFVHLLPLLAWGSDYLSIFVIVLNGGTMQGVNYQMC